MSTASAGSLSEGLDRARPYALGLFRIVIGLLFTCHGLATLFGAFESPKAAAGSWPGWYAGAIHLVAGLLVLIGFGTRSAAFVSSGAMAYAYFDVHQSNALMPIQNGGEAAALFCWAMLLLVFTGSGALGADRLPGRRGTARATGHGSSAADPAKPPSPTAS